MYQPYIYTLEIMSEKGDGILELPFSGRGKL